ncbi:hypothetical protein HDV00_011206, partial [Rhizophlyctis rosea]
MVLDSVLAGPTPPLLYIEDFLHIARTRAGFHQACRLLEGKVSEWYPSLPETVDIFDDLFPPGPNTPKDQDLKSEERFALLCKYVDSCPGWLMSWLLHHMLGEEQFPVCDLFNRQSGIVWPNEIAFLTHPLLRPHLTLLHLLPRLISYLYLFKWDYDELFLLVQDLYQNATHSAKLAFENHILQLCEEWDLDEKHFAGILTIYPQILTKWASSKDVQNHYLRYLMGRSTLLWRIEPLVAKGAWCYMDFQTAKELMRHDWGLEGWSVAVSALQKHQPMSDGTAMWCETHDCLEAMIRDVLELAERVAPAAASVGFGSGAIKPEFSTDGDNFADLEGWIKGGRIEWVPTVVRCEEWIEGYVNRDGRREFVPRRLIELLRWVMKEGCARQVRDVRSGGGHCDDIRKDSTDDVGSRLEK